VYKVQANLDEGKTPAVINKPLQRPSALGGEGKGFCGDCSWLIMQGLSFVGLQCSLWVGNWLSMESTTGPLELWSAPLGG